MIVVVLPEQIVDEAAAAVPPTEAAETVTVAVVLLPEQSEEEAAVAVPPTEVGDTVTVAVVELADEHTPLVTTAL